MAGLAGSPQLEPVAIKTITNTAYEMTKQQEQGGRLEDDYEPISSPPEGSTHRAGSIPPPPISHQPLNISPPVAPLVRQVGVAEEEEGGVYEIISGDN